MFGTRKQCRKFMVSLTRANGFHNHCPHVVVQVRIFKRADVLVEPGSGRRIRFMIQLLDVRFAHYFRGGPLGVAFIADFGKTNPISSPKRSVSDM